MKQNRYFQITVIGDSSASLELCELAEATGKLLAEMGIVVITGGRGGIMEAVSKGVADIGGLSIGIIPSDKLEDANSYCSVVIPTGIGYSRNFLTVLSCDLVIAIGGRAGTLSEIIYGWVFNKPLLALK
ncbi:MAG: TIGR00725 family protein, partial [Bacteroidales bacterium]|nr:TIGR00725 family protein [Bacteroidales bacterium]